MKAWLKGSIVGAIITFLFLNIVDIWWNQWQIILILLGSIFGALSVIIFNQMKGPYWIRGGFIGIILGIIGPLIFFFVTSIPEMIREESNFLGFFEFETMGMIYVFFGIPALIILFILGVITGTIIGKFKSKDNNPKNK